MMDIENQQRIEVQDAHIKLKDDLCDVMEASGIEVPMCMAILVQIVGNMRKTMIKAGFPDADIETCITMNMAVGMAAEPIERGSEHG